MTVNERVRTIPEFLSVIIIAVGILALGGAYVIRNPFAMAFATLSIAGGLVGHRVRDTTLDIDVFSMPGWAAGAAYLLTIELVTYQYLSAGFERTLAVHVGLVAVYALCLLALFSVSKDRAFWVLPLMLFAAVLHRGMIYYASATQLGIDGVFHTRMASRVAQQGDLTPFITVGSKYWYAPAFHTVTASTSSILSIPVRDAAFIAVAIPMAVLPVLGIYALLRPFWSSRLAVLGGLVYLVADRPIAYSVHVTTTSVGVFLFAALLLVAIRYVNTKHDSYLGAFIVLLVGVTITHQLSLLITTIAIASFVLAHSIWRGKITRQSLAVVLLCGVGSMIQAVITRYNGPNSEITILELLVINVQDAFTASLGRSATRLPSSADYVVSSIDALSLVHAVGPALLFCFGIIGALLWSGRTSDRETRFSIAIGTVIGTMSILAFSLPLLGIDLLLANRWFPFMYLPLAILAAPGILALVRLVAGQTERVLPARTSVVAVVILLAVFSPFSAVMMGNASGSLDGPVFDDSPGAQRLTTTPTEASAYSHASAYAGDRTVVADRVAAHSTQGMRGDSAIPYSIRYEETAPAFDEPRLLIDREYAHTNHASFLVKYEGTWRTVFGPLPESRAKLSSEHSVVYVAGPDQIVYQTPPP